MYFLKVVNGQETALSTHHYPHLTFLQLLFFPTFVASIASNASLQLVDKQSLNTEGLVTLIKHKKIPTFVTASLSIYTCFHYQVTASMPNITERPLQFSNRTEKRNPH